MKMTEWRYRFFEDEDFDTEDLDIADDISSNDDKSADDIDISNAQIQSLVQSEIQRQMKSSSLDKTADTSKDTPDITADKQQKGADEQSLYQQRLGQHKSSQHIPHQSPQIAFPLSKAHKHKRRKGHIYPHPMAKVPPKHFCNVVYRRLQRVNTYPANTAKLIPFNHTIKGNYILFSSVLGADTADANMKRVHKLMSSLFNFKYQFLPIYTYNQVRILTDITFAIFPRDDTDEAFDMLEASVKAIVKRQQIGSYVECFNGFHTLITESKNVHYAFGDLDKILDNYTKERGISILAGSRHYLNPYPQTRRECLYRSRVGEIWKGRIQVKSVR